MGTVEEVEVFASEAHAGQFDKIGVPYIEHVRAVAAGLAPFGDRLVMAGLLHDVIEDTDWTGERLIGAGVSPDVVSVVEAVTNQPGVPYEEKIRTIISNRHATLVKIADNAHNSHPARAAQLPGDKRARLAAKYRTARDVLWGAADIADIKAIVSIVNPALLEELRERFGAAGAQSREDSPMRSTMTPERFNELYPIGTPVVAYPSVRPEAFPNAKRIETKTSTKAWLGGGHTPVVMVEGHGSWIALTHVDVVPERG